MVQLKYPAAPGTAAAKAAFGVPPRMLTVLLEAHSVAELFGPGGPGETVLSELVADAKCPPGIAIMQWLWRHDLELGTVGADRARGRRHPGGDGLRVPDHPYRRRQDPGDDAPAVQDLPERAERGAAVQGLSVAGRGVSQGRVQLAEELDEAVEHGWVDEIERLCKAGGIIDEDRDWAVNQAVLNNRLDALVALVDHCPGIDVPARQDPRGDMRGPLWDAASMGFHIVAKVLQQEGADPDLARTEWQDPDRFDDTVALLLQSGANPDLANTVDGTTPIFMASQKGHTDVVKVLLESSADPNLATTDDGATPSILRAKMATWVWWSCCSRTAPTPTSRPPTTVRPHLDGEQERPHRGRPHSPRRRRQGSWLSAMRSPSLPIRAETSSTVWTVSGRSAHSTLRHHCGTPKPTYCFEIDG